MHSVRFSVKRALLRHQSEQRKSQTQAIQAFLVRFRGSLSSILAQQIVNQTATTSKRTAQS